MGSRDAWAAIKLTLTIAAISVPLNAISGVAAALHPVSLAIPSGALVAPLGPSGSGKTTLLRILGGLEYPTSGRVLFDGQGATGLTVQQRRAGFVFQSYALFRHMTVFDNIAFGLNASPRAQPAPRRRKSPGASPDSST